ncbi:hypothetical protein [Mesohalobacter halotolerans]|uniref:Uncharacterized protein n=1 Tax=Mesohalobacter halotolerans TaxID=1883405 RepID=A0A4V6ALH1_9FLAO|nr:hypothetical protein [Mesohalobacter halotolerans]TKS56815.1 hypothetical protein FCN74_07255 [Mesohalobacter halotolerans]
MSETLSCPACKSNGQTDIKGCSSCGYSFEATSEEQSKFIGQLILKKSTLKEAKTKLKRARIALWIIGGYFVLSGVYFMLTFEAFSPLYFVPPMIFGLLFIGFGFLTFKSPIISIVISLILIISYWGFNAVIDINAIIRGLLFKIVILMVMIHALMSTIQAKSIQKKVNI